MAWELESLPEFRRTFKKFEKKHQQALAQMMKNLEDARVALNCGCQPQNLTSKHVHREPQEILAIDQRGGKGQTKELRLYLWPDTRNAIIYLLKVGEKDRQATDIEWCKDKLKELRGENNYG